MEAGDLDALLDEALDEFESAGDAAQPAAATADRSAAPPPPDAGRPAARAAGVDDGQGDGGEEADPLIDELAASMEQLMESIGKADDGKLMRQLEDALSQLESEATEEEPGPAGSEQSPSAGGSADHTLRLLSRSAEALSSSNPPSTSGGDDGLSADLLKKLAEGLDSMTDDDEFASAVEGMMAQLLSKDVMFEPLSQLRELFIPWMAEHRSELSAEDTARYEAQQVCLGKILAAYESGEEGAPVMALMHEMQQHGQPPKELMKDLAPGVELEALLEGSGGEGGSKDMPCSVM